MERIGIIGGTFDPIHLAHTYIAEVAREKLKLERIIFMPNGNPPHKTGRRITDANIRLDMVKEAIKNYEGFEVSDYEIKKQGKGYTFETLEYFYNNNIEIYFITGADCLMDLEKWKNVKRILELCKFVVVTRPGVSTENLLEQKKYIETKYGGEIIFLEVDGKEISSTYIRELINKNLPVEKFLSKGVLNIVKQKELYK